jgi:hypothetical protein
MLSMNRSGQVLTKNKENQSIYTMLLLPGRRTIEIIEAVRLVVATPSLHCHNDSCYETAEGFEQY